MWRELPSVAHNTSVGVTLLCLSAPCLAQVQSFPAGVSKIECRSRLFWIWVDQSFFGTSPWQLVAVNATGFTDVMVANRAAQCGYTITTDVYGNVEIRISFLGCWVNNTNDQLFAIKVEFRVTQSSRTRIYPVSMSCAASDWDVREIVCEENYMEVSVSTNILPTLFKMLNLAFRVVSISRWKVWFNDSSAPVPAQDAINMGYGVSALLNRVVLRSPYNTPESKVVQVGNFNLDVVLSNMLFTQTLLRIIVDTTVACPKDPPVFTATALSWLSPAVLSPLITGSITNSSLLMGVNGILLNSIQTDQNYILRSDTTQVEVTIPYGAPGGYLQSDVINNTYMTTYSVHLILQRQWISVHEDDFTTHTAYKTIIAPVIKQIPVFLDHTVKANFYFNVSLGNFYSDVTLKSFIIYGVPLGLGDLSLRKMTVVSMVNPNNTQAFYLTVPFPDPLVEQTYLGDIQRRYKLYVTYIMTLIPKKKDFKYTGVVQCDVDDVVPPNITSSCASDRVILNIKRGNMDYYWLPYIQELPLNNELITSQNIVFRVSDVTMYIEVPYTSVGLNYEVVTLNSSLVHLNFSLRKNRTQEIKIVHTRTCLSPPRPLLCLANGTMIAIIDSTVTQPAFDAHKAHLRDPSCTPQDATDERAIFNFAAYSCGTTRRFDSDYLVYENEVTFDRQVLLPDQPIISRDSSYRLTIRCRYPIRDSLWLGGRYNISSLQGLPAVTPAKVLRRRSRTHVAELKLAKDENFTAFYQTGDYPVSVQPADNLYFQTDVQSPEPVAALKDCWVTMFPGQDGITRWDLIVDGCAMVAETFAAEVQTSEDWLPRFKVTLHEAPTSQLFIHCKVLICDATTHPEDCRRTCNQNKRHMDKRSAPLPIEVVSAGPVQIKASYSGVVYKHFGEVTSWSTWSWMLSTGLAVISAFTVGAIFFTVRLFRH
ncbi:uncharacterized protein LOC130367569 isoform X2 [Hyla sarda]|uniref:uncharacterized protein LOC130367569 isoform X2 n=1 Tax=Hyla sarda TaxID=327740 RepID=UPI0024C29363|nr:uncharacterized protein LOC130367569 isoform X2 [Hyla sarda]